MKKPFSKVFGHKDEKNVSEEKEENNIEIGNQKNGPADFETAISATGFGKFNLLLLLVAIPSGWASMFESTTVSYIIPVAECDLELSLEDKGYLISITYLGMLSSSMVWGFLSDTLGRKKLLVIGLLLAAFFTFLAGISQTFPMLMFSKFMGGFIINGPFAVLTTVLSEYHCAKYRARVVLSMGIVFSVANIFLPLFAWGLLPSDVEWKFFDGYITLHSWHMFILTSGLPALLSGLGHYFLIPETPKFLMTSGRNDEALLVFKRMYSLNTGKHPDTFPIKELIDENALNEHKTISSNKMEAFRNGFAQMKPLFFAPHLGKLTLVCFLQLGTLMGLNSLRLWLPQIFTAINDYKTSHDGQESSICDMIQGLTPNKTIIGEEQFVCKFNTDSGAVYTNLMIVSLGSIVGYLFVGSLINAIGKKRLYIVLGMISGTIAFAHYFAQDSMTVTGLSSATIALSGINTNVLLTVIVDLFPTSLRTMAVCMTMMVGRFGAMLGNIIFPYLIQSGCLPPFLFVGVVIFGCGVLAVLLPKTDLKALE